MLHGYAYRVVYKHRPDQCYVCLDPNYVAADLVNTVRNLPGWSVAVDLVPFRGDGALEIFTEVGDLLDRIPTEVHHHFRTTDRNKLVYEGR